MTMIVENVDRERGWVTLRPATRWERFSHALRRPIAWLRWKLGRRVYAVRAGTVTLADKNDAWQFREGGRVVVPDPWGDKK